MARDCTVCIHPKKDEINRVLLERSATYRIMADRYGLSQTALKRHKKGHLPVHVAKAHEAAEVAIADDLLQQIKALRNRSIAILQKAESAGDYRTALMGVREARGCIETLMEVEGELDRRGVVNVTLSPQWVELRTLIIESLKDHPDARQAVAGALQSIEGVSGHGRAA